MKTLVIAAFALAIGSAQADAPKYSIQHVTMQNAQGESRSVVTFCSPLDGKNYSISEEAWRKGIREGKVLARFFMERGEKPTGDQLRKIATERAVQIYRNDQVFVDFYTQIIVGAAILDLEGITDPNARIQ